MLMLLRFKLMWTILPYGLIVLGLFGATTFFPRMYAPQEESPTVVQVGQDLPENTEWLTVQGGGLWANAAVYMYKGKRFSTKQKVTEYYVPLVTSRQLTHWRTRGEPDAAKPVIFARLTPSAFDRMFPPRPGNGSGIIYKSIELTGTVGKSLPAKLAALVREDYGLDHSKVVVLDVDDKPATPQEAFNMFTLFVGMTVGGGIWASLRFKLSMPEVYDTYVPPVPEMPAGGWFAEPSANTPQDPARRGESPREMPQRLAS